MSGKNIIVVGAGASGLMAAIAAARAGAKVTLLEHNKRPGKKILATGNGKCNLTNVFQEDTCYRSSQEGFAKRVIQQWDVQKTIQFFSQLGIYTKNNNGYLYPASGQALSVVEVLEMEMRHLQITVKTLEEVVSIIVSQGAGFLVKTKTWSYPCDRVIVAAGSSASRIEGADGSGYKLVGLLGHRIVKPLPALVPLRCRGMQFSRWAGVRIEGEISLNNCFSSDIRPERGELQLTKYGVSGIPVFQLSRYAVRMLEEGTKVMMHIDFMPDFTRSQMSDFMNARRKNCSYKTLKESLVGLFPQKLIDVLMMQEPDLTQLCERIKCFSLEIIGPHSFEHAQVCSGGIDTEEINPHTMESRLHPGLYLCGEIIDVDGACGGYNLQWAWSSGALAGIHAAADALAMPKGGSGYDSY